jgi:HK97 gp10 family phage protein
VALKISRAATGAAANIIKKAAQANISRNPSIETGSLRDAVIARRVPPAKTNLTSEHIVTVRGRGKPANKKGQKIARAPHAHYVEFGTVNMPAEPFLRPAIEQNQKAAIDAMKDRLAKRIAKGK